MYHDLTLFIKGIIIGLTIAAPVGPIGILCLKRTLTKGRLAGLISGLGAATADALYGIVAAFGLTMISDLLICCLYWIELLGALFLMFLGLRTYLVTPKGLQEKQYVSTHLGYFTSTFFLTITNPITLISFLAIFTALGVVGKNESLLSASILVLGVFLGSAAWWLLIGEGVSLFRHKISDTLLIWINKVAGSVLILFGILILTHLFLYE